MTSPFGVRTLNRRTITATVAAAPAAAIAEPAGGIPFVIFCIYTFVLIGRPQDYVQALVPLRLALLLTFLTLAATLPRLGSGLARAIRFKESKLYLFFFLVLWAGIPFSIYRRASFEFVVLGYTSNLIFFFLFAIHVRTEAGFKRVAWVVMLALLSFSFVGVTRGEFREGRYVTGGQMFDSNDIAFVLVSTLPFALGVLMSGYRLITRLLSLAATLLAVLLILFTGSRGGLLGFVTMVFLFVMLGTPAITKFRKALMLACIMIVAYASLDRINVHRYMTLGSLENDYNFSDEFGRAQVWERGFRLFLSNPLTGVGADTFGEAIGTMRARENLTPYWQTAHNSFIQVLTETGFFGGSSFFLLVVTSLGSLNRLRRTATTAPPVLRPFSGVLLTGFVAQLVTACFLSQAYSVLFTLFFAVSVSLKAVLQSCDAKDRSG